MICLDAEPSKNHIRNVVKQISFLLSPRTIAVIGASRTPGKIGHEILRNIVEYGFKGKVYPVNPNADEILGMKCYKSVLDIPDEVDMAVVVIPAQFVKEAIEQCGKKGVKAVAVISSGFGEVGKVKEEKEIVETAHKYGMRLLGPNIVGVYYAPIMLNATFGPRDVRVGNIAFITQSGALAIALMGWTILHDIGLSAIVSLGNKADIDDGDLLYFFEQDRSTRVILVYMEGVKDGRKFFKACKRVSLEKPIIVLKAGRSERGAIAASSHTGSLAGSDIIYDAAFKQTGVLRAKDIQEAFDWARAFASIDPPKREGVVIITNGGGAGVMATDACEENGLKLLEIPEDLARKFRECMPPFGSTKNPIDLTGQATDEKYEEAIRIAMMDERIGGIIAIYCHTAITDPVKLSHAITRAVYETGRLKPITVCYIGGERCYKGMKVLNEANIPAYPTPEQAVSAMAALYKWARFIKKEKAAKTSPKS